MSGYPLFFPEFVLCTNSSLFWFKIANELSEFRNYLLHSIIFVSFRSVVLESTPLRFAREDYYLQNYSLR